MIIIEKYDSILNDYNQIKPKHKMISSKISIRTLKGIQIVGFEEIMYCLGDGRYTRIFLNNGENHLIAKVLCNYEGILPKETFFRIHKSYIVNILFIKEYCINNHRQLVLTNNKILPVAKRRCKCFMESLLHVYPS
jgi:two-component system, LytTR family, response regulator